jgi:glutaryl-CoA dehydrogenase
MSAIHKFGSEGQRREWLPPMARGEAIGAFGLTEPTAGSDPASMKTFARRDGSDWVLNGGKRWIGMGTIADVAVVWAKTDGGIRGFLVPTGTKGFSANDITPKLSMRASVQCDLFLQDVRLPERAMLPGAEGLKGPFACLNEARYGITLDYPVMRHMNNLESVRTYEGTDEVHTLVLGNAITAIPAFR